MHADTGFIVVMVLVVVAISLALPVAWKSFWETFFADGKLSKAEDLIRTTLSRYVRKDTAHLGLNVSGDHQVVRFSVIHRFEDNMRTRQEEAIVFEIDYLHNVERRQVLVDGFEPGWVNFRPELTHEALNLDLVFKAIELLDQLYEVGRGRLVPQTA